MGEKKKSKLGHIAQLARRRMLLKPHEDKSKRIFRKRKHKNKRDFD